MDGYSPYLCISRYLPITREVPEATELVLSGCQIWILPFFLLHGGWGVEVVPFRAFSLPLRTVTLGLRGESFQDAVIKTRTIPEGRLMKTLWASPTKFEMWGSSRFWRVFPLWLALAWPSGFSCPWVRWIARERRGLSFLGRDYFRGRGHLFISTSFSVVTLFLLLLFTTFDNCERGSLRCWCICQGRYIIHDDD